MFVRVMPSLGDAIYHRPFVRHGVRLETKWPALFSDIRIGEPEGPVIAPRYSAKTLAFTTVPGAIARFFPEPAPYIFDLPAFPKPDLRRYAVIRAPTLRRRFYAPARNPRPDYIERAAQMLSRAGFVTVGVGNIGEGEWFDGPPPDVDIAYWRGEMSVAELMGLVSGAALIVAGPGWTVPASIAYRVPHVIVYGGAAKWNALEKLTDPRMGPVRIATVEPDRFCRACKTVAHECDKVVTDFDRKFADATDRALHL